MKSKFVQYYVEGDDEKKLVDVLKTDLRLIKSGKVQKLNVVEQKVTDVRLRTLKRDTMVILVFDTDTGNVDILKKNIKTFEACLSVSEVVLIPQVANLEDELIRSCNIRRIEELLNSRSKGDFKRDLISVTNLGKKLLEHQLDMNLFWNRRPTSPYQDIENQAAKVKFAK